MEFPTLTRRRGGLVSLLGSLVVLVILFRDPSRAVSAASTVQGALIVVVLPVGGVLAGVYAVRGGPYSGLGLFVAGSYLALVGLTIGFGLVPVSTAVSAVGLGLFVLSVVAVFASLRALWLYLRSAE